MVSHWILSDSKSPQVSRTLLGNLSDLDNVLEIIFTIKRQWKLLFVIKLYWKCLFFLLYNGLEMIFYSKNT